jgi:hypothetical protein
VERVLGILEEEVQAGKLDSDFFAVFLEAKLYDLSEFKARLKPRS